jgi:RNA polymerase sigma factor for flagellar operon FliA
MAYSTQSDADITPLWIKWKEEGLVEAKNALVEHYLPLVDYVVNRLSIGLPNNVSRDDLVSHGVMGLIDAVHKFDLDRGLQFETYASWRVRGAIIDGLRQSDWVPRSVREKAKKVEEAYQVLEQRYLRSVTDLEISEYLDITEQEFHNMLQEIAAASICSLEDPIKEDEEETRMSLLMDANAPDPEAKVKETYIKEALAKAIDRLTEKERMVVTLFYYENLSLSEIAEVMSLTPSRISQLHSKAILRLRGALNRQKSLLMNDD